MKKLIAVVISLVIVLSVMLTAVTSCGVDRGVDKPEELEPRAPVVTFMGHMKAPNSHHPMISEKIP